jgi:hypothetical protein
MITRGSPVRLVASAPDELKALLSPVTPETFVNEYWAQKPLFVKGFPDKYAGFFDAEAFSRALSMPGPFPEDFLRASFDKKTDSGSAPGALLPGELRSSAFAATVDQAVPLFDAGATLCVSQIETRVPALAPFIAAIKRQLGYPGKVSFNAYLSPPGSGFNWHFDGRIASTLQIDGTKRWRFANHPIVAWPRGNGSLRADGTAQYTDPALVAAQWERLASFDERDTTEVLLEPGDLLILPAGVLHDARGGAGGSLALNLSFTPLSYTLLIRNLLDSLLNSEPAWRGPAPVLGLGVTGEVDPAGVDAISTQLARAAAALGALSGDSAAVVRLWQSFVRNSGSSLSEPPAAPATRARVLPAHRLRVRADGNVYTMLAEGGSQLCIAAGASAAIELTGDAVPFVQRILSEREFIAGDCVNWKAGGVPYAWSDVEELLTGLKRQGLIEDANTAP